MRGLRRIFLLLLVLLGAGVAVTIVMRKASGEQAGPPVAICPGPDGYGYRCTGERLLEYVDASNDAMLYADDDLVMLEMPFAFTFYGVEYNELWASSNGNLQLTGDNGRYDNVCLVPQPAEGMGDMIAPYWDDLTLVFSGFLETEVVGDAPERTFVIEWDDVPKFGTLDDTITFEVQLFEGSNDIVFLYQDAVTLEGPNGSQATIGLQSERLGYALQASCNQIAVYDGSAIHFVHPEEMAVTDAAAGSGFGSGAATLGPVSLPGKGPVGQLVDLLNRRGRSGLFSLQLTWLSQRPSLASDWRWADLDGDGEQELVVLWWAGDARPELAEIAVVGPGAGGGWQPEWHDWPLARQERLHRVALVAQGDVTGDGAEEVILRDPRRGSLAVLRSTADGYELADVPGHCSGALLLDDANDDGVQEIVVGGCPGGERWSVKWSGQGFTVSGNN